MSYFLTFIAGLILGVYAGYKFLSSLDDITDRLPDDGGYF